MEGAGELAGREKEMDCEAGDAGRVSSRISEPQVTVQERGEFHAAREEDSRLRARRTQPLL